MTQEMTSYEEMEEIKKIFFEECEEHLFTLEDELSDIKELCENPEKINTIFRSVHSIKGGAGAFNMEDLVKFSHKFESVLERFRSKELFVDEFSANIFLKSVDILSNIINSYKTGIIFNSYDEILEKLSSYLKKDISDNTDIGEINFSPVKIDFDKQIDKQIIRSEKFLLNPNFSFYNNGNDIRNVCYSFKKVEFFDTILITNKVPLLDLFHMEKTYFSWEINIEINENIKKIREIIDWYGSDLLGFVKEKNIDEKKKIKNEKINTARVNVEIIDRVVNIVGELVMNQETIRTQLKNIQSGTALDIAISELDYLTHDLQESVMAMRADCIKTVFQRMGRIVREVSKNSEKKVKLHIKGEETEVDRSILEKLIDPLTHMIRNAIDHGIETTEERINSGKEEEGNLYLRAYHKSGVIVVEVEDDGSGLDCQKIYQKAISKNLIAKDVILEKNEIENLIFMPGFSTSDQLSDLSGRGVGMDVVKRAIDGMGGSLSIKSEKKLGTLFSISLPLTLSILEGMIFKVNDHKFVMPISNVVEAFIFDKSKLFSLSPDIDGYAYREGYIPFVTGESFIKENYINDTNSICLILKGENEQKISIIVDEIIDQSRFVIKSIENNYKKVPGFSASTILGDGSVALIIDVDHIIENNNSVRNHL